MIPLHNRYAYSAITKRPTYTWPEGKRLAFWIGTNVELYAFQAGIGNDPAKIELAPKGRKVEDMLLEGEIEYGRIRFDHRHHLLGDRRGMQLRCTSCHSQIVQGDHLTVTTGTCIVPMAVKAQDRVRADFGVLGADGRPKPRRRPMP